MDRSDQRAVHSGPPPSPSDSGDSESKSSDDCSLVCGDSNSLPVVVVAAAAVGVIVVEVDAEEEEVAAAAVMVVAGWKDPRDTSTLDSVSVGSHPVVVVEVVAHCSAHCRSQVEPAAAFVVAHLHLASPSASVVDSAEDREADTAARVLHRTSEAVEVHFHRVSLHIPVGSLV